MNFTTYAAAFGLLIVSVGAASPKAHSTSASGLSCPGTSDEALFLRRVVRGMAGATSPNPAKASVSLSLLDLTAPIDTNQVILVTNDSVCTRITQAVDSAFRSASSVSLIVVSYGSRGYVGYPLGGSYSGAEAFHIVDSTFTYRRSVRF